MIACASAAVTPAASASALRNRAQTDAGHAQHPFAREPGGAQRLQRHFVKRIGHHDHDGKRGRRPDRLRRPLNDTRVRLDQVGARHARRPRASGGDHHHIRSRDEAEVFAADAKDTSPRDPGGMVQTQRRGRREPRHDADQCDLAGHVRDRGQMGNVSPDPTRAHQPDLAIRPQCCRFLVRPADQPNPHPPLWRASSTSSVPTTSDHIRPVACPRPRWRGSRLPLQSAPNSRSRR